MGVRCLNHMVSRAGWGGWGGGGACACCRMLAHRLQCPLPPPPPPPPQILNALGHVEACLDYMGKLKDPQVGQPASKERKTKRVFRDRG